MNKKYVNVYRHFYMIVIFISAVAMIIAELNNKFSIIWTAIFILSVVLSGYSIKETKLISLWKSSTIYKIWLVSITVLMTYYVIIFIF